MAADRKVRDARYRAKNRAKLRARTYDPEARKLWTRRHLLAKYGLTIEDYERMYTAQGGLCKVCRKPETHTVKGTVTLLKVDHCHDTGKVRGLLCNQCNLKLGRLLEDPDWTESALAYLREHGKIR